MKSSFWKALVSVVVALAVGAGAARVATASSDGAFGNILYLHVNTPGHAAYPYVHSMINVGGEWYYSGGSYCEGVQELSSSDLSMLGLFMVHGKRINPWYELVGDKKCLSAFRAYAEL